MAEAGVETQIQNNKYYCHQCSEEIKPQLPEYVCPSCQSGFIEEVATAEPQNPIDPMVAAIFPGLLGGSVHHGFHPAASRHPRGRHHHHHHHHHHDDDDDDDADHPHFTYSRGPNVASFTIRQSFDNSHPVEGILHQLFGGTGIASMLSGMPRMGMNNLHGNPQDYAWSSQALDTIIAQLFNQLEGTGPPPADQKRIEELECVEISKEQVDASIQCSVCLEFFSYDDSAKKLPCLHCYHEDCIVPWLKLHGTCPICRKTLDLEDTTENEYPLNE